MNNLSIRQMTKRVGRKIRNLLHPTIDISDEYIELLTGINAGWLERGNLYSINYAIENISTDSPFVEIGSFCGLSTNIIAYYKLKHGSANKLVNCDKWDWSNDGYMGDSKTPITRYLDFARRTYVENVKMFSGGDLPFTIEEYSDDFFQMWRDGTKTEDIFGREIELGGPISFCFIDGNHDYDFARRDFMNTDEFLEPGGFILFDDSADGTKWEVAKVRDEVIKTKRYEIVAKNPNYLFRKK